MGTINWNEVTKALGEIDYDGVFNYESGILTGTMDEEIAPVALKYMADIGRHLCDLTDRSRPAKK
jgi:sugar phosphate isomerase/epimerase